MIAAAGARAALFDVTGVLLFTRAPVGETYATTAASHGVELPAWRLEDAFGRVLARVPPRVFPNLDATETAARERAWWRDVVRQTFQATDSTVRFADFDAFFDALYRAFARPDAWRVAPGAESMLRALRAEGWRTGAVSNFDHRLPDLLEGLGIAQLLDVVMIPSRCGAAKPEPAIFAAALEALGIRAQAAVYIGHDPEQDAAAATAAGLQGLRLDEDSDLREIPTRLRALATLDA